MQFQIKDRYGDKILATVDIDATEDTDQSIKLGMAVQEAYRIGVNLEHADLKGANLENASIRHRARLFYFADLQGANFSNAHLRGVHFSGATLIDVNFSGADLSLADLVGADLVRPNFNGANLDRVNFEHANFIHADLRGALMEGATLRRFKADFWMVLTQNRAEVPGLIAALYDGRTSIFPAGARGTDNFVTLWGTLRKLRRDNCFPPDDECDRPAEQWFDMLKLGDRPGDDTAAGFAARMAIEWAVEWCSLNGVQPPEVPKS